MFRIGLFLVQVALRADVVGDSPGDALGSANHDAGHAGVGTARSVE